MAKQTKQKILLVDDDPFIAELYVVKFESAGFEIKTAPHAKEALKIVRSFKPNLILLDLIMPVMDGFEFLEIAKKDKVLKEIPVVAFTNRFSLEYETRARNLGVDGYFVKMKFMPDELVLKIKEFLEVNLKNKKNGDKRRT
jgi:CheY-like chemotaxis protein